MALYGELLGYNESITCECCGAMIPLQVCRSTKYYIGYFCIHCGPISRESNYFETKEEAETALNTSLNEKIVINARSTNFKGG